MRLPAVLIFLGICIIIDQNVANTNLAPMVREISIYCKKEELTPYVTSHII